MSKVKHSQSQGIRRIFITNEHELLIHRCEEFEARRVKLNFCESLYVSWAGNIEHCQMSSVVLLDLQISTETDSSKVHSCPGF